tara:strand:- start:785 stop:973 length:189 start_codon:yes stop_codon:yes gene_type:complete
MRQNATRQILDDPRLFATPAFVANIGRRLVDDRHLGSSKRAGSLQTAARISISILAAEIEPC